MNEKNTVAALAAFLLACTGIAAAKEKPAACVPSETALPAPAEATKRSRLVLQTTTPAAGQAVHPATVIGVDVEYHVADFVPDKFQLITHFAQFTVGASVIVGGRDARFLTQADGVAHLCVPIAGLFRDDGIRWPLQMRVSLQKRTSSTSSIIYADSRHVEFTSPDLSAKVLERQKSAMPEEFYLSLDEAFSFFETHRASYKECTARFPELVEELEKPFGEWTTRTAADSTLIETLQLERYTEATRNTTSKPADKIAEARSEIAEYIAREQDLNLRRRCTYLPFVFAGTPREFIGRYLAIVDEQVARRAATAAKPAK